MKKIVTLLTCVFLFTLTSCGKWNETNTNTSWVTTNVSVSSQAVKLEDSSLYTPVEVKYDSSKKEVKIGEIVVKKWFPDSMRNFPSPSGTQTYVNSNVKDYYFFTTTKSKKETASYYAELFKKLEGTEIKQTLPEMPKIEGEEPIEQTYYQYEIKWERYALIFSDILPENLKSLNLSGMYVELRKE